MTRRFVRWLYGELPDLVRGGVLSGDAAESLRRHYGQVDDGRWRQVALTISGVLGALLIGFGIIFVLAYNWSALSRSVRTVLSLVPLLMGQGVAGWVLWQSKPASAWREGAAAFLMLALVASIALIQQTYHVASDFDVLLLPCLVLGLPVIYLLGSSVAAILYLVGVLVWAGAAHFEGAGALAAWLMAIPLVPHIWLAAREDRYGLRAVLLMWAAALWAGVAMIFAMQSGRYGGASVDDLIPMVGFPALYATMCLAGRLWLGEGASMWRRPLATVGTVGVVVLAYVFTFRDVWHHVSYRDHSLAGILKDNPAPAIFVGVLGLAAVGLLGVCIWKRRVWGVILGVAPVLVVAAEIVLRLTESESAPAWLFNAYVLGLGAAALVSGFRERRLVVANLGVLLVAMLLVGRLIDSEMGFLVKGIACIVAGIGFLATNLVVHRLRRRALP